MRSSFVYVTARELGALLIIVVLSLAYALGLTFLLLTSLDALAFMISAGKVRYREIATFTVPTLFLISTFRLVRARCYRLRNRNDRDPDPT